MVLKPTIWCVLTFFFSGCGGSYWGETVWPNNRRNVSYTHEYDYDREKVEQDRAARIAQAYVALKLKKMNMEHEESKKMQAQQQLVAAKAYASKILLKENAVSALYQIIDDSKRRTLGDYEFSRGLLTQLATTNICHVRLGELRVTFGNVFIKMGQTVPHGIERKAQISNYTNGQTLTPQGCTVETTGFNGFRVCYYNYYRGNKRLVLSRSRYRNGMLHGLAVIYYTNGRVKRVTRYVDDKRYGLDTSYSESGQKNIRS